MTVNKKASATTAICEFDANNILIRGKNLVDDIMGKYSFMQLLLLQTLGKEPSNMQCTLVDAVLVTIMEHGLVPSAVATRLTYYGAPESFQGAVAAGLLGVGDRYAGTVGECGAILERIMAAPKEEREAKSLQEVEAYRRIRRPVPGFGHPIHRHRDPRVEKLLEIAADVRVKGEHIKAMKQLETTMREVLGKSLAINISAAIAAVLGEAGIPSSLMRGIVLTARCAGLVGHLFEEMNNPVAHQMWDAAQASVDGDSGTSAVQTDTRNVG